MSKYQENLCFSSNIVNLADQGYILFHFHWITPYILPGCMADQYAESFRKIEKKLDTISLRGLIGLMRN